MSANRRMSTSRIAGTGSPNSRVGSARSSQGGAVQSLRAAYMTPRLGQVRRRPSTTVNPPRLALAQHPSPPHPKRAATAPSQFGSNSPPPTPRSRYGYNNVQQYGTSSLKPPEQFSFIWALQNFAEIRQRATFYSQQFIDTETDATWKLKVLTKQKDARDYIGVTLICMDVGEENEKIKTSFEIAVLDGDENPFRPSVKVVQNREFSDKSTWSLFQFVKFSDLDLRGNRLLVHDTLRIQCTLWKKNGAVSHVSVRPDRIQNKVNEREIQGLRETLLSFKKLLTEEKFTDLKIITPMKTFNAHKVVLCARSKVFEAMLTSPMRENEKRVITIVDFEKEAVHGMLEYVYTGEVTNLEPTAGDLLRIAEKYDLPGLRTMAEDSLTGNITLENACHHLALAHIYNAPKLMKSVHKFISVRSEEIRKTPGFEKFAKDHPDLAFEVFLKRR